MTISEVLEFVDELKPNQYLDAEKINWLSKLDHTIFSEIISTHENPSITSFDGYDEDVDRDTVLLAPAPYDSMYSHYIESQIDLYNAEYTRYNNSASVFNADYASFSKWYRRNHMPLASNKYKNVM